MWSFWAVLYVHTGKAPSTMSLLYKPILIYCLTGSSRGRQRVKTVYPILQMRKVWMEKALDQQSGHLNSNPLCFPPNQYPLLPASYFLLCKTKVPSIGVYMPGGRIFALPICSFIHSLIHSPSTSSVLDSPPNTEHIREIVPILCEAPTLVLMLRSTWHRDFPGGAVVKNPPANAGDTGSIPGLGRSHMPQSN